MIICINALGRALALTVLASLAMACGGGDEKSAADKAAPAVAAGDVAKPALADEAKAAVDDGLANAVAVGKTDRQPALPDRAW